MKNTHVIPGVGPVSVQPATTYKLCPHCGEPIEPEVYDAHVADCDGSIPVHESIAERGERLADRHLRYDGSERGRW